MRAYTYFWSGLKPGSSVTTALLLPNLCVIIAPVTCSATTSLGIGIALVVPSPSWPSSLSPHVNTSPWSLQATQWSEPVTRQQLAWHIICHRCSLSLAQCHKYFLLNHHLQVPLPPIQSGLKNIGSVNHSGKNSTCLTFLHKTKVHLPILMWLLHNSTPTIT
jgi:hypothetical protein